VPRLNSATRRRTGVSPQPVALTGADVTLVAGGVVFLLLAALCWRADIKGARILRERRFDDDVDASLEQRYLDSHSFRDHYNSVHEVVNHPAFMVGGMVSGSILAIMIGYWYVFHLYVALSFVVLVFIIGLTWYFGDAIEAAFFISFAGQSTLRRSDKDSVTYHGKVLDRGRFYLLAVAGFMWAAAVLDSGGVLPADFESFALIAVAFLPGLVISASWWGALRRIRPTAL